MWVTNDKMQIYRNPSNGLERLGVPKKRHILYLLLYTCVLLHMCFTSRFLVTSQKDVQKGKLRREKILYLIYIHIYTHLIYIYVSYIYIFVSYISIYIYTRCFTSRLYYVRHLYSIDLIHKKVYVVIKRLSKKEVHRFKQL